MERRENELYPPIEQLFRKKGYFVVSARKRYHGEVAHSPFGVDVHGKAMKIDAVAFSWLDEWGTEACAVECKPGRTWEGSGKALGQATAYQRLFPKVYVASEATEEDLKHVESLLRQLGLGYIMVKDGVAEEIFPPSQNIRFNQKESNQQVRTKAMILLAYKDVFGDDDIQFGRADRPGEIWVSDRGVRTCNIFMHLNPEEVRIGLNLEEKKAIREILGSLNTNEFYDSISKLNSEYEIFLSKFVGPKILGKTEEVKRINVAKITLHELEDIIRDMRELNWLVCLQIQRRRKTDELRIMSKQRIIDEVEGAKKELSPLYNLFKSILAK